LDDLLCITKGSLEDHLNKLRQVLTRLQVAVLLLLQLLRRHHPCRLVRVESEGHCSVILIKYWIGRHY